ncbi:MAG: DUF502 domain-containing protein [Candidatus Omnitrophica bacterium]|nr:DUF502 domain-containing protein [Candidatus Omnitrophota bacterium]
MKIKLWNRFLVNFFNGIVLLLPAVVTIWIIRFVVIKMNDVILSPLVKVLAPMAWEQTHGVVIAKTLIFIGVIFTVALIGWGAKIWVINRMFALGENIFIRVPIMGKLYTTSKQIFGALIGQGKTIFKQVVLIEYPREGLYTIAFTTGTTKGELKDQLGETGVNVFVPTTPNPTSGFFLVIPRRSIRFLNMSVEDGMKLVVSGGSVSPVVPYVSEQS